MLDNIIAEFDKSLRTLFAPAVTVRPLPGTGLPEAELSDAERAQVVALMRVNHCGEICAQALYQGQSLTSHNVDARRALEAAAFEETEHLNWTASRIAQLGGRTSLLNPLWYLGSLAMGVAAGKCGDAWNLGFLAETERQVEDHLQRHIDRLPRQDGRSRAILDQMKRDETCHADMARRRGAHELPGAVKFAMKLTSGVMTRVAYYI